MVWRESKPHTWEMTLALTIARDEMIMSSSLGIIAVVALAVIATVRMKQASSAGRIEISLRNARMSDGRVRILKSIFSIRRALAAKARADDPDILRLIDFQIGAQQTNLSALQRRATRDSRNPLVRSAPLA